MKLTKTKNFFIPNPGAIFIALFAYLLLVCAYFLITGFQNTPFSDLVGVSANCCLVAGVILQAVGFIKAIGLEEDSR